jgi:hypothetical protein
MRVGHRIKAATLGRACAVTFCAVTGLGMTTGSAGAAPTALQFGAPTGSSCSEVDASFGQSPFSGSALLLPDGLPLDGWNGVSLLGLLEGLEALVSGGPLHSNCGDVAHGSSDNGLGASASSHFADGAGGPLTMSASVQLAATNPLTAHLGEDAMLTAEQTMSATFSPLVPTQDQQLTISVSYTVLSANPASPIASFAEASLNYVSGPLSPSCAGQNVLAEESGTVLADSPGTYTTFFTFSCPIGEALTASGPIQVDFAETQAALATAESSAQSFSGTISAQLDGATVSYS